MSIPVSASSGSPPQCSTFSRSDVMGPKIASEAISQHQVQKIFMGSMPPDPSSLCVYASVRTRVQLQVSRTNAILLPLGLYPAIHTVQFGGRGPLNFTIRKARAPIAPPFHRSWWQINILEQQGRDGQVMCRLKHHNYYFQIQCNCTEWTESGVIFF